MHLGNRSKYQRRLMCGAAALALAVSAGQAVAREETDRAVTFAIAAQPLADGLNEFARQSGRPVMFTPQIAAAKVTGGFSGAGEADAALEQMLAGTGLAWRRSGDTYLIVQQGGSGDPQSAGAGGDVDALIVTAQKREENIQDVPIAISAFSQEDLTRSQIAGGPDLITQVPNMTFTKTNFSSYSVQLRGIGTQAISATTDPAVAVAFNNTPFIRNRFFEQEFYDLQRVEVLRGPQGTLYGRNATAGVVNIISAKPSFRFEAKASADVSNFNSSRVEGMVNIPLVEDGAALRVAGAWTKRDGYAENEITGDQIDGRDLWSTRVSLRLEPNDAISANLIWEHFEEDDDRLRSGKQLCDKHVITHVGDIDVDYFDPVPDRGQAGLVVGGVQSTFSQGCERGSLYSMDSFQTPNGMSIPYYFQLGAVGLPRALLDPYVSEVQTPDLRVIESTIDPIYRSQSNLGELQVSWDLSDTLTLQSETAYAVDEVYSLQDFNRFNTAPGAWLQPSPSERPGVLRQGPNGGIFCDPQLGCSDRLVAVDISTAEARQFSQEFRLSSDFDGAFNFSVGGNFLRADSEDKYYVFINSLSLIAATKFASNLDTPYEYGVTDNRECMKHGYAQGDPEGVYPVIGCIYTDPNPIESVNDEGHNYFLSKNPYKLISYAVFGEAYYNVTDTLKVTAGLRWTVDKKEAPRIPTWLLATQSVGYPVAEVIEQEWREPTGRLTVDWKPDFSFTDETLLYASFAHGYKAGGANPPGYVRVFYAGADDAQTSTDQSMTRPRTFEAEFVDALEVGSKNTFADGRATVNLAAFYYDYKNYQISEIVDRSAFNRNFDATVWGVELEADWRPLDNLRLGIKGGYEKTRIADGEEAIDLMDRTAGMPGWSVVRPFPTFASSCILPTWLYTPPGGAVYGGHPIYGLGGPNGGNPGGCEHAYLKHNDPVTEAPYVPNPTDFSLGSLFQWQPGSYPGWDPRTAPNNGEGFSKQLGGNELPNAPNWTATITADYTIPLPNEWLVNLHTDLHWQSESWWRVFNDHEFNRLDEYFTMNLAAIFTNEEAGWNIMAYIKNVTDETAITGAFLNSDDTGLTTNVFLTEPRLYGLRVTKMWSGGSLGAFAERRGPERPYPFRVEIGGQVQRHDAPYGTIRPSFADEFSAALDDFGSGQHNDLDWGDGRQVKLSYAVPDSPWSLSAGMRVGRTNGLGKMRKTELGSKGCVTAITDCESLPAPNPKYYFYGTNYIDVSARDREEHQLIDFDIGRDVGLGSFGGKSALRAGVRYGEFKSQTHFKGAGIPDWYIPPEYAIAKYSHYNRYTADFLVDREFKGLGPTLSWDASKALLGDDDTGRLAIDWTVTGGVLFGKQKVFVSGEETASYFEGKYYPSAYGRISQVGPSVATPGPAPRSKSASVPVLDLSLSLSYEIQRVKVGAGYRWERYFDAIDGGFTEHEAYDRTIDGPYFKVSVGFGG